MAVLNIKRNDRARPITDTFTIGGTAIDLTGCTVKARFKPMDGGDPFEGTATITDAAAGQVSYPLAASDVAEEGSYLMEWEITFSDGKQLTVPEDGFHLINIIADIA